MITHFLRYRSHSQSGFSHHLLLPVLAVLGVAVIGSYVISQGHAAAPATYSTVTVKGVSTECMDNKNGKAVAFNPVQIYKCVGNNNQKWSVNGTATAAAEIIAYNGYCLNAYNAGKTVGTAVDVYPCKNSPAERWTVNTTTGEIENSNAKLCVTYSYPISSTGSLLKLGTCSTGASAIDLWTVTAMSSGTGTGSGGSGGASSGATSGGCTSSGAVAPCVGSGTTGASGWGTPIFDDEFNGTSLDTSKWSTGWFGSGITGGVGGTKESDCYDPSQVAVSGGELDLKLIKKTETCDGAAQPYATGFITTDGTFSYSYGFVEARMWLPGNGSVADWPSFWQDGQNWPTNGELDIMEGLSGQACGHWHGPSSGGGIGWNVGSGCASGTYTGGWHTFGANWQSSGITWYYDGKQMGTVSAAQASNYSNSIVGGPQYLILGMGAGDVAPATQRVDYVRVWK